MKKKYYIYFFLILVYFIISSGCANLPVNSEEKNISEKPIIAVSIPPQEEFVREVAGNDVDVLVLIPSGKSPANYAPTVAEMQKLSEAVLFFSIGVPAEKLNIIPRIKEINNNIKVIDTAKAVAKVYKDRQFAPGKRDPHIWLSPQRVKLMVKQICEELSRLKPDKKSFYQKNKEEYLKKLDSIDRTIKGMLQSVSNKTFIIYHPALGYFADEYKLTMLTVEKEGKEATIQEMTSIIKTAKEKDIKVLFCQAEHDTAQAKVLAKEMNGRIEKISPLSRDYTNALMNTAKIIADSLK